MRARYLSVTLSVAKCIKSSSLQLSFSFLRERLVGVLCKSKSGYHLFKLLKLYSRVPNIPNVSEIFEDINRKDFNITSDCLGIPYTYDFLTIFVEGVLSVGTAILGVLGNLICITVLSRPEFQDSQDTFHHLLLSLSCFDLLFLCKLIFENLMGKFRSRVMLCKIRLSIIKVDLDYRKPT